MKKRIQPYKGLKCTECQSNFADDELLSRCPRCNGLLDTVFDEDVLTQYSRKSLGEDHSMWRFRSFLPISTNAPIITAGEGGTPLRKMNRFSGNVRVKDETRNPTGTFKDRGASSAVSSISQLRARHIVLATEGNAGCSFALYSQMAGIACSIYLPRQANPAKVSLSKKLGAKVTRVTGTIGDAGKFAAKSAQENHLYNASSFVTPFRHDGKGTMALEICEQLGWQVPDFVVYPIGGGVGLVGMWKMFNILERIGWTKTKPCFIAAQPAGCSPVIEGYRHGKEDVEEWKSPQTIAQGLRIPKPLAGKWILKCLRESKATGFKVTDQEIRTAMRQAAKRDGLILEPSSAAAVAAVPQAFETGVVDKSDKLVVIATGSGLKTLDQS